MLLYQENAQGSSFCPLFLTQKLFYAIPKVVRIAKAVRTRRGALLSLPFIYTLFSYRAETEKTLFVWIPGVAVFLLGFMIRVWSEQHIRRHLGGCNLLARTGPYQYTRNPLYLGNILLGIGICIVSELIWFVPFFLIWYVFIYSFVIHEEEKELLALHGNDYETYLKKTPRWFPRFYRSQRQYLTPQFMEAIRTQSVCFLLFVPYIFKELFSHWYSGHR